MKDLFNQVQDNIDDLLTRKTVLQNKVCLLYGFVYHLFKMVISIKLNSNDQDLI